MVPNPHSSSSTLPCYFAVGYSSSTSGWHILWHDPQGKPLSGAASAPQRSDGPAALPYHSPAGAPYVKAQMKMNLKKRGGGVHNIYLSSPISGTGTKMPRLIKEWLVKNCGKHKSEQCKFLLYVDSGSSLMAVGLSVRYETWPSIFSCI